MTDATKKFVAAAAAGLFAATVAGLVLETEWSNWRKAVVAAAVLAITIIALAWLVPMGRRVRDRVRAWSTPAPPSPSPGLAERIDETWFVTFTSGPYRTAPDDREEYVTAIAAVDGIDGDDVKLRWRDQGSFPSSVPIKLLTAHRVGRFRGLGDERRLVSVQNDGLRYSGPGGVVTGSGWRLHDSSPHRIAFARYAVLSPADKAAMEADADLDTYNLDAL